MPNPRATDAETKILFYVTIRLTVREDTSHFQGKARGPAARQRMIDLLGYFTIAGSNAGSRSSPHPPESFHH